MEFRSCDGLDSCFYKMCFLCSKKFSLNDKLQSQCKQCKAVNYCSAKCCENDLNNSIKEADCHANWCWKLKNYMSKEEQLCDKYFDFANETCSLDFDIQKYSYFLLTRGLLGHGMWRRECFLWMDFHLDEMIPLPGELNSTVDPFVLPVEGVILESDPEKTMPKLLSSWSDYYNWRGFSSNSPICILLQWPLTIYHIICNLLSTDHKTLLDDIINKKSLCLHLIGVEKEVELLPCFTELVYLFTGISITLVMVGKEISSTIHNGICAREGLRILTVKGIYSQVAAHLLKEDSVDLSAFPAPDLVLAFNAGFAAYISWPATLEFLRLLNVVTYVTDYCEYSMELSSQLVDKLDIGTLMSPRVNPFRSPIRIFSEQHSLPSYSNAFISELVFPSS